MKAIRTFLEEYARTMIVNRFRKRNSHANRFTQLDASLTEGMQALQLDVAVDAWATEGASDRLQDLDFFMAMMERMEFNITQNHAEVMENQAKVKGVVKDNHAEVMDVLKSLGEDKQAELKGWVEIDYNHGLDFESSRFLGSWGFGDVRTAKWKGADVAVKHLSGGLRKDSVHALRKEVRVHSRLHFDFVALLYAASTTPPNLCLVLELASGGSLQQYLYESSEPLSHALQAAFLYDVARGMWFLHDRDILHRDLKSANALVCANGRLKLCDFGLSKVKTDLSTMSRSRTVGTSQWMAPEVMKERPANERTDVYSFGVLCF
eukprot:g9002.t1